MSMFKEGDYVLVNVDTQRPSLGGDRRAFQTLRDSRIVGRIISEDKSATPTQYIVDFGAKGQGIWYLIGAELCRARSETKAPAEEVAGRKDDAGKPRMDLLLDGCPRALWAVGEILTFGAQKYADHSWQRVEHGMSRYRAAEFRHQLKLSMGQPDDDESHITHLAHVATNALFVLELELRRRENEKLAK